MQYSNRQVETMHCTLDALNRARDVVGVANATLKAGGGHKPPNNDSQRGHKTHGLSG